jgi:hypothetical protein
MAQVQGVLGSHFAYCQTLAATLKDDTIDYKQTVKRQIKCQPFAK